MEHITQNHAVALAMKHGDVVADRKGRKDFCFDDYGVHALCNAAIQHYLDSQPKPASVDDIMKLAGRYAESMYDYRHFANEKTHYDLVLFGGAFTNAITKQAEALAHALAEVERLKEDNSDKRAGFRSAREERDQLRAQLAALQYDGGLPEPVGCGFVTKWTSGDTASLYEEGYAQIIGVSTYTADQVRQAIANALAKQIKDNAELSAPTGATRTPCYRAGTQTGEK